MDGGEGGGGSGTAMADLTFTGGSVPLYVRLFDVTNDR
jgi:hypothetical protein